MYNEGRSGAVSRDVQYYDEICLRGAGRGRVPSYVPGTCIAVAVG